MHNLYRNLLLAITDDFRIGDGTKRTDAAVEALWQAGTGIGELELSKASTHLVDPVVTALQEKIDKLNTSMREGWSNINGRANILKERVDQLESTLGIVKPVVEKTVEDTGELARRVTALENLRPRVDPKPSADSIRKVREKKYSQQPLVINCRCGAHYEVPSGSSREDAEEACPQCDHGLMNPTYPLAERINVAERWGRKDLLVGLNEARLIAAFPRGPANVEELRTLEALDHDIIGKIDWKMLSQQKVLLVGLLLNDILHNNLRDAIQGIIHLIDALEDWHDAE